MESKDRRTLSAAQQRAALALAQAMLPVGRVIRAGDQRTVDRALALFGGVAPGSEKAFGQLAQTLDNLAILRTGGRFHRLGAPRQQELIGKWERDPIARWPLFAMSFFLKTAHFDDPEIYRELGCVYEKGGPAEPARWMQQVFPGEDICDGEEIECDAVVVGTGAGGAIVGKELADKGFAVVFLEEGQYHRRDSFTGNAAQAHDKFYRGKAGITTLGNNVMPIFMGRMVGGSTAINTATCFRTPPWVLEQWCEEIGTEEFLPERMQRHFERVERELQVGVNDPKYIGAIAKVVARGCEKLGWRHAPVRRNAPDCDGQGVCDFGCPTGAKRSTDVSYVPAALQKGSILYTGMRADKVRIENGKAVGILGKSRTGKSLWVRSRVTILACGSIPTPLLLLKQGICNSSGQVGRNLSVHPSSGATAIFDDKIEGYNHIPQGYLCDQFHKEGILLLGAQPSINVGGLMLPFSGKRFMDVMDKFDRLGGFGVLVRDQTRNGVVRRGPGEWPIVTYNLTGEDVRKLQLGIYRIGQIFFAAGAKQFFPVMPRCPEIENERDLERFRTRPFGPMDFLLTSWHPLGTCQFGKDKKTSVVNLDHETHDVKDLFIVDGSVIPGPPAVNSQETIMGFADRAAERIGARLDGHA